MSPAVAAPVLLTCVLFYLAYVVSLFPENEDPHKSEQYRVPYMPFPPLIGICVNYFLVAQLEWLGITMIFGYFGLATVAYFAYGVKHSVGNRTGWAELLSETHTTDRHDFDYNSESGVGLINDNEDGLSEVECIFYIWNLGNVSFVTCMTSAVRRGFTSKEFVNSKLGRPPKSHKSAFVKCLQVIILVISINYYLLLLI